MSRLFRSWLLLMAVSVALLSAGCSSRSEEKPVGREPGGGARAKAAAQPTTQPPITRQQQESTRPVAARQQTSTQSAAPPAMPTVALSDELRSSCLVNVGDPMPDAQLPDPAGKMHTLRSLYGQKLTVVCFWAVGTSARSKLVANKLPSDLMKGVVEPYGEKGVAVIGVNVGDSAQAVEQHLSQANAKFSNLRDSKGEFFNRVAKEGKLPRTFVLDATGRILWFDLEYSRSAQRDLIQAIRGALGEK